MRRAAFLIWSLIRKRVRSNPDLEQIHSCVDKVKKDPEVQEVFMTLEEYVEQKNDEERKRADAAENRAKVAENRADAAENRADAAEKQLCTAVRRLMNASNSSFEEAANVLGIEGKQWDYYRTMLHETEM